MERIRKNMSHASILDKEIGSNQRTQCLGIESLWKVFERIDPALSEARDKAVSKAT